jgi:hypothetical protein
MSLDLVGAGTAMELRVRVIESRPVIVEGTVRHRIRLNVTHAGREVELTSAPIVALETDARAEAV